MDGSEPPDLLEAGRFQCDLYRYWRAVATSGGVQLGARRYLARGALREIHARLDGVDARNDTGQVSAEPGDERLFFVRRVLERLGLLRQDTETRLVAAPREEMERFLALNFADRIRLCTRLWVAGGWWVDRLDERQEVPSTFTPAPPRVALARRHALQELLELPQGDALPVPPAAGGAGTTRRRAGGIARRRRGSPTAASRVTPAVTIEPESVRAALLGPLGWLGLVQVSAGGAGQGEGRRCRVTPALEALRLSDAQAPVARLEEPTGRVVVQATFEVIAVPPLAAPTLALLDACAEPKGSGQAARYVLTPQAYAAVHRAGWRSGRITAQLERLAGTTLPQNVEVTLADWDRQAERLRLRRDVALLTVPRAAILDALLADPQVANAIERRVTPTLALVKQADVFMVRTWLLRHGEMPAMGQATEAAP